MPRCAVQDKYLQGRAIRVRRILAEAALVVDAMATVAGGQVVTPATLKMIEAPKS